MNVHARNILGSSFLAICLSLSFVAVQAATIFGSSSRGSSPASIYSIDTVTGEATLIGTGIGLIDTTSDPNKVSAIALDPISGAYYAIWGSFLTGAQLITIDLDTGLGTVVGPLVGAGFDASDVLCFCGSDGLVFGTDGTLYASGWNGGFTDGGSFLTLDKSTGAVLSAVATEIHPGSNPMFPISVAISGLARAPDGTLWVSRGNNGAGLIHTIDPDDGSFMTTLELIPSDAVISDLVFGEGGGLYGSAPRNTGMLVTIDTDTGAVANVGAFGGAAKIAGLASVAVEVPIETCADPGGCNPTQNLNIEIPPSIPIPPGTIFTQTVASRDDPRPGLRTCGTDTLVVFFDDPEISDLIIPPGICGDPFIVVTTNTDLEVLGDTIIMTNEPDAFFGVDAKICQPSIPDGMDPQNEDEVVWMSTDGAFQDDGFANTTTFECGSSRGRSRGFSHNVIGMSINFSLDWDADPDAVRRAFVDMGHSKHHRLIRAVKLSKHALPYRKWKRLVAISVFANLVYHWHWYEYSNYLLTRLLGKVENLTFDTDDGYNHAGNITTRADNLRYFTDKYVIGLED